MVSRFSNLLLHIIGLILIPFSFLYNKHRFFMKFKGIIHFHSIPMKFSLFHEFWYKTGVKLNRNRNNINSNTNLMIFTFSIQIFNIIRLILVNFWNLYLKYMDFHSHFSGSNIVVKDQSEVKLIEISKYLTQFLAYTL